MSVLFKLPNFDRHTFIAINDDIVPDARLALASVHPLLIAMGAVDGSSSVNKFGENKNAPKDIHSDIWDGGAVAGGHYVFPATATITHIRQATDQAGTDGGATIELQGLDANWELVIQTADLDAVDTTVEVVLTTPLIRVFRKKVLANVVLSADVWSGATGMAALTAKSIITAGKNQTLMAIYTVPAGKTAYMSSYYYSVVNSTNKTPTSTEFAVWAADRAAGYEFQLKHEVAIPLNGPGNQHYFNPPLKFTEKTDIRMSAEPIDEAGYVHAGFDLVLIDN
jgi:hypothetical protein